VCGGGCLTLFLGISVKAERFVLFIDTILSVNGWPIMFDQDRVPTP
jgi:hypothetical protein